MLEYDFANLRCESMQAKQQGTLPQLFVCDGRSGIDGEFGRHSWYAGGCTCSQRMLALVRRSTCAAADAAGAGACCSSGTLASGRSSELRRLLWGVKASAGTQAISAVPRVI